MRLIPGQLSLVSCKTEELQERLTRLSKRIRGWWHHLTEANQRKPVSASSGAQSLRPYNSLAMNHYQAGMADDEQRRPPAYVDRTAHAVEVQLVSLASAGDDSAFTALVTRYHPAVFRWALTFSWDPDEAEDIAQEVFVRAHRQLSNYRSDGSLEAWLYAITRRATGPLRRTEHSTQGVAWLSRRVA